MKTSVQSKRISFLLLLIAAYLGTSGVVTMQAQKAAGVPVILNREQSGTIMPPTVFYRGQTAAVQARNSAGLRFPDSKLVLAALVDTSGYSTSVQETYQAYLITEVPLKVGDRVLNPGAYGFGFIAGDTMVAMDLGAGEVLRTSTTRDAQLARPNPLQILSDPASTNRFRLYLGRSYVTLEAAAR